MNRFSLLLCLASCISVVLTANSEDHSQADTSATVMPFGQDGQIKMLYDCRQRPQSVFLNDRLYIVYNGDTEPSKSGKEKSYPMLITYDPKERSFSKPVRLSQKKSSDHHYCPIIWADTNDHLHVLFGCHITPGTHLISKQVVDGSPKVGWQEGPQIAPKLSYPTVFRIDGGKQVIYYRTGGHTSSWTYRISEDQGKTWIGPENDVTDLDSKGRLDWSSYQTKLPSADGKHLHVVYTDYDDNKTSPDPQRFFNPRYNELASNEWKYNLSYVKIDLESDVVYNFNGETLKTPIDIDSSKQNCQIWDTKWRGAGVPPAVTLDENGDPAYLHVLSEDSLTDHRYYYVRRVAGQWKQTPITHSNHQWNSCHLSRAEDGTLNAYLIVGDGYLDSYKIVKKPNGPTIISGYMDKHGGGSIEQWTSSDKGNTWQRKRDLTPSQSQYPGWKFNNIRHVTRPDGSSVDGMFLFYGWKDHNTQKAKAFLLHESK